MPSNRNGTETLVKPKIGGRCGHPSSGFRVRRQAHNGGDLINQLLVELRSIHNPGVLHDRLSGWTVLRVRAHAVIDQIQSCLWMPLHALGEISVVPFEKPLLIFLLIVKEIEVILAELLIQRVVEEKDREQSASKSIDVCLVDYKVRPPQKYFWSLVIIRADQIIDDSAKLLSMTEVNECQTLSFREHDIVGLNITMSGTFHRV